MNEILQILSQHPIFSELNEEELQSLSTIVEREIFNSGEVIFEADKKPQFLYYIESGSFTLGLSNNEYKTLIPNQLIGEIGIVNGDYRSGRVIAAERSSVIKICGVRLFQEEFVPTIVALKIVRSLGKSITNYLRSREQISTFEIIGKGENESVEFKSTLRWNLYTDKKDKAIEKAALKTLSAFMNSSGGILIIGINDEGEVLGLDADRFESHDKLMLHLTSIVKKRIGAIHLKFIRFSIEELVGREILRIDCSPATIPAYLKDDNSEHLYIRNGPSTTDLRLSKVYDYVVERFIRN